MSVSEGQGHRSKKSKSHANVTKYISNRKAILLSLSSSSSSSSLPFLLVGEVTSVNAKTLLIRVHYTVIPWDGKPTQ